jgi:hypothetical protein
MARTAAILLLMLGVCAAVPAAAQDSELVGYTATLRNGAGGILVFNELCDDAFPGVGSHVCTSADFVRGNLPTRPSDPGSQFTNWVAPSVVGTVFSSAGITVIDRSGKTGSPANLTCDGWASASATVTGLTANDRGMFVLAACSGARNIACCVPSTP